MTCQGAHHPFVAQDFGSSFGWHVAISRPDAVHKYHGHWSAFISTAGAMDGVGRGSKAHHAFAVDDHLATCNAVTVAAETLKV